MSDTSDPKDWYEKVITELPSDSISFGHVRIPKRELVKDTEIKPVGIESVKRLLRYGKVSDDWLIIVDEKEIEGTIQPIPSWRVR